MVRGNNDKGPWADAIAETNVLEANDVFIYVLHDIADLDLDPSAAGFRVVVFGHSHRPSSETRDGVLYVNPGSAGPRRFRLPICVGELQIADGSITARHVELEVPGAGEQAAAAVPGRLLQPRSLSKASCCVTSNTKCWC